MQHFFNTVNPLFLFHRILSFLIRLPLGAAFAANLFPYSPTHFYGTRIIASLTLNLQELFEINNLTDCFTQYTQVTYFETALGASLRMPAFLRADRAYQNYLKQTSLIMHSLRQTRFEGPIYRIFNHHHNR